jgi:MFS family permease
MYTVLPTHTAIAGISIAAVGIILSANRWVRLLLNGPMGLAYDRWRRRPIFVVALFLGAISTGIYAYTSGFWPLMLGRVLWGLSWAGIWVGGNAIVFDVTDDHNRGKLVGAYQISFFLGAASGAFLGGSLTDFIGYSQAMKVFAVLSLFGATVVTLFLPETRQSIRKKEIQDPEIEKGTIQARGKQFVPAIALLGVNRFVVPGMLTATFGLFLAQKIGDPINISGRTLGVATVTGVGLGIATVISMISAPASGLLSDRLTNRWKMAALGLLPGILGFILLAIGSPLSISLGVPLIAYTSGSNQGLSTSITGDTDTSSWRLGILFTAGDLASAMGPLLAYALIPVVDIAGLYFLAAGLFGFVFIVAARISLR